MSDEKHGEEERSEEIVNYADELISLGLEWSEQEYNLKEFNEMHRILTPILISKGEYGNSGLPTLALAIRRRMIARAQCLRFEPGKVLEPVGPVYEIEDDYEGWLEIVSAEGKEMSYLRSVAVLARCIDKTFALMTSLHAHQIGSGGEWETCTLYTGYCITVKGEETLTEALPDCGCRKLLRCDFAPILAPDGAAETVYLPLEGTGRFAYITTLDPLVGPKTIATFGSWMCPVNVRVMEGSPLPEGQLTPYLRIWNSEREEVLTVMPPRRGDPLVHVPSWPEPKLRIPTNLEDQFAKPRYQKVLDALRSEPPHMLIRETHRQPSSSNQILKSDKKYSPAWIDSRNVTFEGMGYNHASILPKEDNEQPSVEHTNGIEKNELYRFFPSKYLDVVNWLGGPRSSDRVLQTLNLDYKVGGVPVRHSSYAAALLAAPRAGRGSRAAGNVCMRPSVGQQSYRVSSAQLPKNRPSNIEFKKTKDVQHEPNLDCSPTKRRRSDPIKIVKQTFSPVPIRVRRSLGRNSPKKDEQNTPSPASIQPSRVRRSLRIEALQRKDEKTS